MKKKDLKNLVENNGLKVIDIDIYENGKQANVWAIDKEYHLHYEFIITKNALYNNEKTVKCLYLKFGMSNIFRTELFR